MLALAVTVLLLGCVLHTRFGYYSRRVAPGYAWGVDDAYITYRYARNLAAGHGLVYNPGERVEGYSNLLYAVAMALPIVAGADQPYAFSVTLNTVCAVAACLMFFTIVQRELDERLAAIAALLFAANPLLWLWVGSGMESVFVLLLNLWIWHAVIRVEAREAGSAPSELLVAVAASILARADGFVMAAFVITYFAVKGRWRTAAQLGIVAAAATGTQIAARLAYYGQPMPNTYYAKISGPLVQRFTTAGRQLGEIAKSQGIGLCILAILLDLGRRILTYAPDSRALCAAVRFPDTFALLLLAYWVYVGGDWHGERFLLVLYPFGIVSVLRLTNALPRCAWAYGAIGAVLTVQLGLPFREPRFGYVGEKWDAWIELGRFLRQAHPEALLAIDAAGKVPYFSGLRTIDMLGLTDAHIGHLPAETYRTPGHNKHDTDYVLAKQPDLIAAMLINTAGDMNWGLGRKRYRAAGYQLRYLLYFNKLQRRAHILDVQDMSDDEVGRLIEQGYWYGVLVRRPIGAGGTSAGGT